ncbi:MAG: RluA family pseudouridine synthase [Treponema sp.]|nr:RluA family pseudouridine synthase [Treponema sp.]
MEFITGINDKDRRLDRILRKALPDHPLALIHRLLRTGKVLADGKPAKAQDRLDCGVKISIPSMKDAKKPQLKPDNCALPEIIWESSGLLAVNKPAGLAVHGSGSLDTMVNSYLAGKLPESLSFKPGPLHRLDKPSSGIVVFSTSLEGARLFTLLMRERKVRKTYLAIVEGGPPDLLENEVIWQDELVRDHDRKKTYISQESGKTAITKVKPLAYKDGYSLIQAEIVTGRTHQIRAQAASHGYPLLGDRKYGGQAEGSKHKGHFFLHAWKLDFLEYSIVAPLPDEFRERIRIFTALT